MCIRRYGYQFVPIHDTEIGGAVKDCGLRNENYLMEEERMMQSVAINDKKNENVAQLIL